jgi:CBS domain containing-hemolysin-like protein
MMALPAAALVLLVLALFLDEAVAWFARRAVEMEGAGHEAEEVRRGARKALHSRLVARGFIAAAAGLIAASLLRPSSPVPDPVVGAAVLVWALLGAALVGVRWGSPLSLAGRALFRPFRWLGTALRGVLAAWGRLPGPDLPAPSMERAREIEEERRWLRGERDEDDPHRRGRDPGEVVTALAEFGTSRVEDVMVEREAVIALPAEAGVPRILDVVADQGFSRYPVYAETLDTVVGVLHVFDLFRAPPEATAGSLARPPFFTVDTKSAGTLLRELQVSYNQMAVVVDEYGGTAGVVTVEDLLEEVVGEIGDEHDEEDVRIVPLESGSYRVEGSVRVDEVNESLGLELETGEYDTVAGLVLERLERIPRVGERVKVGGIWIEVLEAEPRRIRALKLTVSAGRRG